MSQIATTHTFDIGDGRNITIETGKLAKQADGSVVIRQGNTMLLATVVSAKEAKPDVDFMPLTVEYQERYAANGRFPGGFFKREARPSEYEILISRLVDRALRPLFPDDYHAETQVVINLISAEKDILPDALACLAASAALAVSNIPFKGPVSEVRVCKIDDKFIVNPTISEIATAQLDIIVAATEKDIMMVEGEMKEVSENDMVEALKLAHEYIRRQCQAQLAIAALVEKANPKRTYCHEVNDEDLRVAVKNACYDKVYNIAKIGNPSKHERSAQFSAVCDEFIATIPEEELAAKKSLIKKYFHDVEKKAVRDCILNERTRLDGRQLDQIRPIWCEVGYLPSAHGSAIFTRGETQSLTTVTLGSKLDEQMIDGAVLEGKQKFILHYNFPPYSTGESKPMRGTSRREIGHGNLALRALKPILPSSEVNPYTVRIVSDILESNGSSSMATVCAGTLALMDAGVKILKPVSGIAMGLITDSETGKWAVLSDILGDEDHLGDMDFKVCGTKDGITACQMDIKVDGLSYEVLAKALDQAKQGRMHILGEITKTISAPREDYKPFVPRIIKMTIPKEFIGAIIGPGGKVIQEMQRETETTIVIEEVGEFGIIDIVSDNAENAQRAINKIKGIVTVPEIGQVYDAIVKSTLAFGAVIEILPGKEGLLHISEFDWKRIENVEDVMKTGDTVQVKLIEKDPKSGKLKFSRKALIPRPERKERQED